jgi:PilZ domain
MALPVMTPERRRSPRISLSALAYITFDSNCGGIVVNISDEGLCFHTIAPIERSDTIHFWFSADGKRIEAQGRLIWTDETRKTGGLRFNVLSAEASRQIRNWIVQSSDPFAARRQIAAQPPLDAAARSGISKPAKGAVYGSGALKEWSRWMGTPARWGEFSRGLATGILIAIVVAAIFLFHTYKHRIGESLIFLGERFGATPHSETASRASTSASPSPQATGSTSQRHTTVAALSPAAIPSSGLEEALVQPAAKAAKPAPAKLAPKPVAPAISLAPSTAALPIIDFAAARPGPPPPEAGGTAQPESADRSADKTTVMAVKPTGNSSESAEDIAELNSGVPFGRYFDAGRFKDELGARNTTDDLARIGIHAIVVPKHHLWMNSYQVIVGPYRDTEEMQVAGTSLRSHGFKTHSLPRQSRGLTLVSSTVPQGLAEAPTEQFVVNWESYSPEVTVNFVKAGDTVAKAQGKWVKRSIPYDYDAIVYKQNGNGSRTLLEIWFHGMSRAVVLPSTHPVIF